MVRLPRWLAPAILAASLFSLSFAAPAHAYPYAPTASEAARFAHHQERPTAERPTAEPLRPLAPNAIEAARFAQRPVPRPLARPAQELATALLPAPAPEPATNPTDQQPPGPTPAPEPAANPTEQPTHDPAPQPAPQPKGKLIFIDPGHGFGDPGAVHITRSGVEDLLEKDANLAVALRLADLLLADGYDVQLMRTDDGAVRLSEAASLQARADRANEAGADLFISVHHNGSENRALRGTEVYYCAHRSFGDDNRRLAQAVLDGIVRNLRQAGYDTPNRGIKDEAFLGHFAVLAPANLARPTRMPGILGEALFISNDQDAAQLARPEIQQAIAQGYFEGIRAYFGETS